MIAFYEQFLDNIPSTNGVTLLCISMSCARCKNQVAVTRRRVPLRFSGGEPVLLHVVDLDLTPNP